MRNSDCGDDEICDKKPGGNYCKTVRCNRGLKVHRRTKTCVNVNECIEGIHDCEDDEICIDMPGSFRCEPLYEPLEPAPECSVVRPEETSTTRGPCLPARKAPGSTRTTKVYRKFVCPSGMVRSKRSRSCVKRKLSTFRGFVT